MLSYICYKMNSGLLGTLGYKLEGYGIVIAVCIISTVICCRFFNWNVCHQWCFATFGVLYAVWLSRDILESGFFAGAGA